MLPNGLDTSIGTISGAADPARMSVIPSAMRSYCIQHKIKMCLRQLRLACGDLRVHDAASMWWRRAFNYGRLCRGASQLLCCSRVPDRETLSPNQAAQQVARRPVTAPCFAGEASPHWHWHAIPNTFHRRAGLRPHLQYNRIPRRSVPPTLRCCIFLLRSNAIERLCS